MKNILLGIFGLLSIVVAYFIAKNPLLARHYLTLISFGKYLPGFETYGDSCDTTPKYSKDVSTRFTKHKHCFDANGNIKTIDVHHNETLMKEVLLAHSNARCPVVIRKPFKDHKCFERLNELAIKNPELNVRVKESYSNYKPNNDKWFPTEAWIRNGGEKTGYRDPLIKLLKQYEEGPSGLFTAFDNTLDMKDYENLWGIDMSFIQGKAGSTFLSNFNQTFITTPLHAAFWDSYGYQCQGHKHWKLMTPEDALPTVRFHTIFTVMKGCNNRPDIEEHFLTVDTYADDLFYFPPYWAHSVRTEQGLSVLLNYRKLDFPKIIMDNPALAYLVGTGLVFYKLFHDSWDPDEVTYYYLFGKQPNLKGGNSRSKDFLCKEF